MSEQKKIPLNAWQKEILKDLKSVWSSIHDCKKVHADFVCEMDEKSPTKEGKWFLNVSPIIQEIVGGMEDGAVKNSCFFMDLTNLILMPNWEITSMVIKTSCSFCKENKSVPAVNLIAKFKDCPIEITIYLSPVHDTIQDTICTHQKR